MGKTIIRCEQVDDKVIRDIHFEYDVAEQLDKEQAIKDFMIILGNLSRALWAIKSEDEGTPDVDKLNGTLRRAAIVGGVLALADMFEEYYDDYNNSIYERRS